MTRALLLMFCSALLCCPIVSAQLAAELRQIAAKASLGPEAVAGIAVYDAHTGIPIYESAADVPLAPASNQKLLTSAAAVKILGPAFAFRTALHQTPEGLLILVGSGDPALGDPEVLKELSPPLQTEDVLTGLASAAAAQILSARGLVIDDRVFDRELIHPDWPADQLDRWYCAPVQGINIHANVLAFYPSPGDGAGPTATIEPDAPWIEMVNRAEAISEGRNAVWVQRSETDDRYTLRGKIRTPFQSPIEVSVQQPALLAGRLVADRMDRAGVSFSEPPRLAESHDRFELSEPPLAVWSTALDDTLYRCNYDSMNLYAEALLKRVGHEVTGERGGWANGAAVLRMLIAETLGPAAAADTIIRDGSGLSRDNRVTARTMARWLAAMHGDDEVRPMYLATLPSAEDKLAERLTTGPLSHRLAAKTGTINRVRCLSGYVYDESTGRAAAFSVLCNGLTTGESIRAAYRLQSDIVAAIDKHLAELSLPADPALAPEPAYGG